MTRIAEETPLAACAGMHWGQIVYREGDYHGAAVNIAARLAAAAERHQVLVTAETQELVGDLSNVELVPLGSRVLKGVVGPQELFAVRRVGTARTTRRRDLVCGMELAANEVAARLQLGGTEQVFCSETCLRHFVSAPDRYLAGI